MENTLNMATEYYPIFYSNGESERAWRYEDMLACRFGPKKVKQITRYRETIGTPESHLKVEVIYEAKI